MDVTIISKVDAELGWVHEHFDEDLFKFLLPPGAELIEFGGSKKGDIVHLKLPIAGEWISEIVEDNQSDGEIYFIDVGKKLPFPLKEWTHKHVLIKHGNQTIIEDRMSFSTGSKFFDVMMKPVLWSAFAPRKQQYRKYFKQLKYGAQH